MGIYDGMKLCKFIGIYLLSKPCTIISNNDCGLYTVDGLMMQEYINGQKNKLINIFKKIGCKVDFETTLKIADFLYMVFNLINGSYRPQKKPKYGLDY